MSQALAPRSDRITEIEVAGGTIQLSPAIVRRYCVTGNPDNLSDQEAYYTIARCRAYRLNPFIGEIHVIKYGINDPAAFVIPKESFLKRAHRHPAYLGFKAGSVVMREADGELNLRYIEGSLAPPGWELIGGWAEVHRSDQRFPVRIEVALGEYVQMTRDGRPNRFWREKPATMIRKVALVQALREAFPEEFQGLFERDEVGVPEHVKIEETPAIELTHDRPRIAAETAVVAEPRVPVVATPPEPRAAAPAETDTAPTTTSQPPPHPPAEGPSRKQARSRRRRESVDPALFDGKQELLTAGVEGPTLNLLYGWLNDVPASRPVVETFLARLNITTEHPTYLRQDEAEGLLTELGETFPSGMAERVAESDSAEPSEPTDTAPTLSDEGLIACPDDPGGSRKPLYCSERCRSRDDCASFTAWQSQMRGRAEPAPVQDTGERPNLF